MRGCLCNADPGDYMYSNKAVMDLGKTLQAAIFCYSFSHGYYSREAFISLENLQTSVMAG